ncbi:DUF2946 domain-containing protein [Afipia felis]
MRKRLGHLVPIVMIAVLVQFFAPIAMMRAAVAAASDPLSGIVICSEHVDDASGTAPAATHGACCPLCALAHVAPALDRPVALHAIIQRIYQRVAWLESRTPARSGGLDERPHARGPPVMS